MRARPVLTAFLIGAFIVVCGTAAAQQPIPPDAMKALKTLQGGSNIESASTLYSSDGYLRFMGAPAGGSFAPSKSAKGGGSAESVAKAFLNEHAKAFGILNAGIALPTTRVSTANGRTYVKLGQTFNGVNVLGAGAIIQMNGDNDVVCVNSDIMREAPNLYSGALSTTPSIGADWAVQTAKASVQVEYPDLQFATSVPELLVYAPTVIGNLGPVRIVWSVVVESSPVDVKRQVLVDAHSGSIAFSWSLICEAKFRRIYDANDTSNRSLARQENEAATGIFDVDQAYAYYGDTYDFYANVNGRDSINDSGMIMSATVRFCPSPASCPFRNAFWNGSEMYFGAGYVVDDVVGHELTHGVTQYTSNLIYANESGAINESLSDMWGEWIDQSNTGVDPLGDDSLAAKWWIGEDIPSSGYYGGAFRYMKNPPVVSNFLDSDFYPMPDKYLGPGWFSGWEDGGGVHHNSGVGNKVCYLITDGGEFNGYQVTGLGISAACSIVYEAQTNLLNPSSDYPEFGLALIQAAINLGANVQAVKYALFATEILPPGGYLRNFRAQGSSSHPTQVALTWNNPDFGPFTGLRIVRNTSKFPSHSNDGTVVTTLVLGEWQYIDSGLATGSQVFYGLFPEPGSDPENEVLYARVIVGHDIDYLSENYVAGTDLTYRQILIAPHGSLLAGANSGSTEDYFNYDTYDATITDATSLPVAKENIFNLPMNDDGAIEVGTDAPFPFFGRLLNSLTISANGCITAIVDRYAIFSDPNFPPNYDKHFEWPRISFLFSDLNPAAGGQVWGRYLDDRMVVTFEDVPAFGPPGSTVPGQNYGNTVQCELFYSGHIRFTYGALTVKNAVVGISDGRGIPLLAEDLINNVKNARLAATDLTVLTAPLTVQIDPIPIQYASTGDIVEFTVHATSSSPGAPVYALLSSPGGVLNPATGEYAWNTDGYPSQLYEFGVIATVGSATASQIINVYLTAEDVAPEAQNLSLVPTNPADGDNLLASYDYVHPSLPEGPSAIFWFKNNAHVPAFNNLLTVPAPATKPNEKWYFTVLPTSVRLGGGSFGSEYLRGAAVQSPIVTIGNAAKSDANQDGKINSVDLQAVVSAVLGAINPKVNPDVNGDGNTDASDLQTTVNSILFDQ